MQEANAGISLFSRVLLLLTNINHILAVICGDNYVTVKPYFDTFYHFNDLIMIIFSLNLPVDLKLMYMATEYT